MRHFKWLNSAVIMVLLLSLLPPPGSIQAGSLRRPAWQTEEPTATPTETETSTPPATDTPTSVPTDTATVPPSATSTSTETATATPSETATPSSSATSTSTETVTPPSSATSTSTETATATPSETAPPSSSATSTSTETVTPPSSATSTSTETATPSPSATPTPSRTATASPSGTPSPIVVSVVDTNGQAEAGLAVYAFDGTTYTNYSKTTNATGVATFTLPLGNYRFRADKNGTQFWSGPTNHCAVPGCVSVVVTTTIPVVVNVTDTSGQAEAGLAVYAFDGTTYTNYSKTTNATGVATFTLPLGNYRFRADKNGTQFWSGPTNHCAVPGCVSAAVTTTIPVRVTVMDIAGQPEANLPVYAFNGITYTNYSKTTNATGVATFTLPLGEYRFRADKNGTQFWSDLVNHCPVPGCATTVVTTSIPVVVNVVDTNGQAEAGLTVYAFDGITYTNYSKTTNATGQAAFTLPVGEYRFRADKNGTQYWSGPANHCAVPGCVSVAVTTTIPVVVNVVDTNGQAEAGLAVYAFDGITYTNYSKTTNATGVATFTLPLGEYRFRADKNGTQFWSGPANHCAVPGCVSVAVTTTIPVVVNVADTNGQAEAGLSVYAFDGITYTNYSKTTNATGVATFTLPLGEYRFRADKNGTQFWSALANHCAVPGCVSAVVTTTIPVVVNVVDTNGQAEAGLSVYAFDGITYTNYSKTTNATGVATFTLPVGEYRFRADKNGSQFWSGPTNHCTVPGCVTVTITLPGSTRNWQLITPTTTSPPVSGEHSLAYDNARNRVVLYGGNADGWPYENTTWEFDGTDWLTSTTGVSPTARYGVAMAYDNVRQTIVLFGGSNASDTALAQTWEYTNSNWVQRFPVTSPLSRTYASLVAGPNGRLYLFGGNDGETYFDDLWRYDNGVWTEITVSGPRPPARTLTAMTYDPGGTEGGRLLLFGGRTVSGTLLADLWTLSPLTATTWTQLSFSNGPSARMAHTLAYDPVISQVVLVGGATNNGLTLLTDTWHYNHQGSWTLATPIPHPQAYHQAVYGDNAIILFGNKEMWRYE